MVYDSLRVKSVLVGTTSLCTNKDGLTVIMVLRNHIYRSTQIGGIHVTLSHIRRGVSIRHGILTIFEQLVYFNMLLSYFLIYAPILVNALRRTNTRMTLDIFPIQWTQLPSFPICLETASKSTTFEDPTAGMTDDQIANYVSNVGGGLCGSNEFVKALVGVSLNLSLIIFAIFTLSYGILSFISNRFLTLLSQLWLEGRNFS